MLDFTNSIANEIKDIWSKYSFFGYRKITAILNNKIAQNSQNKSQNKRINHKKVLRLMQKLGLQAIYAKPRTTVVNKDHKKFPYLLKDLEIAKPNQVWSVDITYIKTSQGLQGTHFLNKSSLPNRWQGTPNLTHLLPS